MLGIVGVDDKKLLGCANLYIAEGAHDGNNLNPWNAPPAANSPVPPEIASWWEPAWGYSEWNRSWSSDLANVGNGFQGLNTLPVGNGAQTVRFPRVTPLRALGGTRTTPNSTNYLENTVAYSFPQHSSEPGTGDAGSQDSPFDYIKKILVQRQELGNFYSRDGQKYLRPRFEWPLNLQTTTDLSNWTQAQFIQNIRPLTVTELNLPWNTLRTSLSAHLEKWEVEVQSWRLSVGL